MKLRSRRNTNKKLIIIVAAIVLALVLIGTIVGVVIGKTNDEKEQDEYNKTIIGINVALKPTKDVYYVGEEFDPTGFLLQIVTNGIGETSFVEYNEDMIFSGFDSSAPTEAQTITVSYMDFVTTFVIQIKEEAQVAPTLERIEVYNFKTEYTLSDWNLSGPDVRGGRIRCIYSDGSVVEDILLKDSYIDSEDVIYMSKPGKTEITVKYSNLETTVEITVTN